MAVLKITMAFPLGGQASQRMARALQSQTPVPSADADARHLAEAVGRGDEAAFQALYDLYHERLFRLALVVGRGDEALARETVQSVFVTAAAKLQRVESEAHLWNWLAQIARQNLAKAWRQRQRDSTVMVRGELPDCAEPGEADSGLEQNLDAALLALEPDERQLLEWFYFDRLSHKEIAGQLNTTPKAISSRLERARARLRAMLARKLSHET